jgi:hypothetical protein
VIVRRSYHNSILARGMHARSCITHSSLLEWPPLGSTYSTTRMCESFFAAHYRTTTSRGTPRHCSFNSAKDLWPGATCYRTLVALNMPLLQNVPDHRYRYATTDVTWTKSQAMQNADTSTGSERPGCCPLLKEENHILVFILSLCSTFMKLFVRGSKVAFFATETNGPTFLY